MEGFGDIEDIWKNNNDERTEKTEVTIKKKKQIKKENKQKEEAKQRAEEEQNEEEEDKCCDNNNKEHNHDHSHQEEKPKKVFPNDCCESETDCTCMTKEGGCCSSNSKSGGKCCSTSNVEKENAKKKREIREKINEDINNNVFSNNMSSLPGVQKVFVKTYGCSHNTSDSEYMMGLLHEYGYQLVENFEDCDACVINSCTVKNPSQDAFINYISKARKNGKKVVVSGCVPQGDRTLPGLEECSVVGVTQIDRIVEVVEETLKGNIVKLLAKKELPSLDLPKIRRNAYVEIVPINTGCLGSCTYCKTKHARGKLGSYEIDAIVKSCLKASKEGVKEIWLTSEDTGAYGRDINTDLPELMMEILKNIPEDVMIRVGMTNPPYIMEHLEKMAKILNHPNCFSFLHIPVQCGSNPVLDKMNREYKVEDFKLVCDYLIANVPGITLATDIICGFPSETKEQFDETLDLIDKYKFPVINISQFYPRPGTVAAKWKRVDTREVKRRSTETAKLFFSYPNYDHLKNTIQRVWVHDNKDEGKAPGDDFMIAHTKSYAKVLLKRDNELIGKQVLVKINDVHKWHVYGDIIDRNPKKIKVNFMDHFKGVYKTDKKDYSQIKALYKNQINIHDTFNTTNANDYKVNSNLEEIVGNEVCESKNNKLFIIASNILLFIAIVSLGLGLMEGIRL